MFTKINFFFQIWNVVSLFSGTEWSIFLGHRNEKKEGRRKGKGRLSELLKSKGDCRQRRIYQISGQKWKLKYHVGNSLSTANGSNPSRRGASPSSIPPLIRKSVVFLSIFWCMNYVYALNGFSPHDLFNFVFV